MNQATTNKITLELIGCFLAGKTYGGTMTEDVRAAVFTLAAKHDVLHLLGEALGTMDEMLLQAKRRAIYRYLRQEDERQRIYGLFEGEGIPFIPLKGSVIGPLYHDAWQRTGCDIDILVKEDDLARAQTALEQKQKYKFRKKSAHDVSLMSPVGVHLELHYAFDEKEVSLDEFWGSAAPLENGGFCYAVSPKQFLLHHIAHMAKHFRNGGCGLRPFVDLWFILGKMVYDKGALEQLMQQRGLRAFWEAVTGLLELWFGEGKRTPILSAAEEYILPAGMYGSLKNRVAVGQLNKGGKRSYFLSRLIQPREVLEYPYPALKKQRWLLPFCQVHRWCRLLADGKLKQIANELQTNEIMDAEYRGEVANLLEELGLYGT